MMEMEITEILRRLTNIIRVGTVAEADYATARVRIDCGDVITDWLPWVTRRAGGDRDWWGPEPGEQVMVLSPSGVLEDGVVLPALYCDVHPEPAASADVRVVEFGNGARVMHNRETGAMLVESRGTVTVNAEGDVTVKAPRVTLDTPQTTCTGKLTVQGLLTYQAGMRGSGGVGRAGASAVINGLVQIESGDVIADGISLKRHTHTEQGDGKETSAAH